MLIIITIIVSIAYYFAVFHTALEDVHFCKLKNMTSRQPVGLHVYVPITLPRPSTAATTLPTPPATLWEIPHFPRKLKGAISDRNTDAMQFPMPALIPKKNRPITNTEGALATTVRVDVTAPIMVKT